MTIEFKRAAFEDLHEVAELYNEFLFTLKDLSKDPYFNFQTLSVKGREDLLKERYQSQGGMVALAIEKPGGKPLGFVSVALIPCFLAVSEVKEIGYIEGAYVRPAYRKLGIVKTLEVMVENFLKERGVRYLELNTLAGNQVANDSWTRLGFEVFRMQWRKDVNE